jgi:hypothetical protein
MKMTYTDALTFAIDTLSAMEQTEQTAKAIEKMDALRTTYTNRNANRAPMSDEAKKARKEANAAKRAELVAQVAPTLRSVIDHDMTAKEIFAAAQAQLPEGFTAPKVQNILIREMAPELVRTERKKGGDLYRLAD